MLVCVKPTGYLTPWGLGSPCPGGGPGLGCSKIPVSLGAMRPTRIWRTEERGGVKGRRPR